jgi:two-component system, cell cycle sensor histidine kinase and response regulator CckA
MCVQPTQKVSSWSGVEPGQRSTLTTILYVEDEAFVREATCEVLRSAGYSVLAARRAAEAVELYHECCGEVDLLLTDVVLPGESGPALAGRLRQRNPRLRALFVTGYPHQMRLLKTRDDQWLAKPFSLDSLLGHVRCLLREAVCPATPSLLMPVCGSGEPA